MVGSEALMFVQLPRLVSVPFDIPNPLTYVHSVWFTMKKSIVLEFLCACAFATMFSIIAVAQPIVLLMTVPL